MALSPFLSHPIASHHITGLRLLLTNILIRLILFLTQCCRRQQIMGKTNRPLSLAEQEFVKEPYLLPDNLLLNYSDSCTFFGYAVLFSSALPAAPAFAFLNKFTDLRYEAYQLLYLYRRPVVSGAEDIGNWQTCFEILSTLGVVTNAGLLVFTMKTLLLPGWTIYGRMWIFIGFQWALYISQLLIRIAVPDVPVKVTIQKKRQDFIVSKIIFKEPDEDSTDVLSCTKLEEFKDYPPIRDDGPSSSRSPFNESPIL